MTDRELEDLLDDRRFGWQPAALARQIMAEPMEEYWERVQGSPHY